MVCMVRFAAIALLAAGLVLPASAQRSMSRGGFSSHSAGSFQGGFAAPHFSAGFGAPRFGGFSGNSGYSAGSFARYPNNAGLSFRPAYSGSGVYGRSGGYGRSDRYRRPYPNFYGYGGPALYAIPAWIGLGSLGYYPDVSGYDDSAASSGDEAGDYGVQPYAAQPVEPEQQAFREDYEPTSRPPSAEQAPASENATTIVFNDGRPSEQIHNYALTRTTLYVLDAQHRDIPLDQINLSATQKVNGAVGVEFQVPQISQ
jgi:hypothetical protein